MSKQCDDVLFSAGTGSHSQTSFLYDKYLWWEGTWAELCWDAYKWCKLFVFRNL